MARWGYYPKRSEFVSDGLSWLRIRREYQYSGSTWQWVGDTRYVYDGMCVIQERDSNNTPTVSYSRGVDLSGSLEGAGGIGGLLARSHGYSGSTGNWSTHNFYHADGGGNVTYLINAGQSMTAQYRYDPFGRTTYLLGTMATANTYRFSSKEMHSFTGMYYYGYRFYDPLTQRWLNRDPIAELGGINLYAFVLNSPLNRVDPLGRSSGLVEPIKQVGRKTGQRVCMRAGTLKLGPIGGAIVTGTILEGVIEGGSILLYPDPGCDPLPLPKRAPKPKPLLCDDDEYDTVTCTMVYYSAGDSELPGQCTYECVGPGVFYRFTITEPPEGCDSPFTYQTPRQTPPGRPGVPPGRR